MRTKKKHISEFVYDFLCVYLPKRKCRSPQTIDSYRTSINLLLDYLEEVPKISYEKLTFESLNHNTINNFLEWLENTRHCVTSTRNQRFAAIRSFLKFAAREDVTVMPFYLDMQNVDEKKPIATTVTHLTPTAMASVLSRPDISTKRGIRNRFLMILMYDAGARLQEILKLKLGDFTISPPVITVMGKGQKQRRIPISTKTVEHFEQYIQIFHPAETRNVDDYLFYTVIHGQRKKMCSATVQNFIAQYGIEARDICKEVPQKVHPHLFRHTRAMDFYTGGMSLEMIQKILGHVNLKTTEIYAKADTEKKREAIAKARSKFNSNSKDEPEIPIWKDKDNLRRLSGLK